MGKNKNKKRKGASKKPVSAEPAELITAGDDLYVILTNKGIKSLRHGEIVTFNVAAGGKSRALQIMSREKFDEIERRVRAHVKLEQSAKKEEEPTQVEEPEKVAAQA